MKEDKIMHNALRLAHRESQHKECMIRISVMSSWVSVCVCVYGGGDGGGGEGGSGERKLK